MPYEIVVARIGDNAVYCFGLDVVFESHAALPRRLQDDDIDVIHPMNTNGPVRVLLFEALKFRKEALVAGLRL